MPLAKAVTSRRVPPRESPADSGDGSRQKQHGNVSSACTSQKRNTVRSPNLNMAMRADIFRMNNVNSGSVDKSSNGVSAVQRLSGGSGSAVLSAEPTPQTSPRNVEQTSESMESWVSAVVQDDGQHLFTTGEEIVQDFYKRQASSFFEELRCWFSKEVRMLRKATEKQMEDNQVNALHKRIDQLEENVARMCGPSPAGDMAAEIITSDLDSLVSTFHSDVNCDSPQVHWSHASTGCKDELQNAVEVAWADQVQKRALQSEVAELRAAVEKGFVSTTMAELGRLDGELRGSLAAEVRELGCICESVRFRVEALDRKAAEHVSRLDARLDAIEQQRAVVLETIHSTPRRRAIEIIPSTPVTTPNVPKLQKPCRPCRTQHSPPSPSPQIQGYDLTFSSLQ